MIATNSMWFLPEHATSSEAGWHHGTTDCRLRTHVMRRVLPSSQCNRQAPLKVLAWKAMRANRFHPFRERYAS